MVKKWLTNYFFYVSIFDAPQTTCGRDFPFHTPYMILYALGSCWKLHSRFPKKEHPPLQEIVAGRSRQYAIGISDNRVYANFFPWKSKLPNAFLFSHKPYLYMRSRRARPPLQRPNRNKPHESLISFLLNPIYYSHSLKI